MENREVRRQEGAEIRLTPLEYRIIECLLKRPRAMGALMSSPVQRRRRRALDVRDCGIDGVKKA
jgi:hypothetical protein